MEAMNTRLDALVDAICDEISLAFERDFDAANPVEILMHLRAAYSDDVSIDSQTLMVLVGHEMQRRGGYRAGAGKPTIC